MPRPALTRTRIVAAGVAVVREMGLDALSPRTVARRVNATATGVNRHISATELVQAVVAEIVATMPAVPDEGGWRTRLAGWATETRAWLLDHPGLAGHLLQNRWSVPIALDRVEDVAGILEKAGLGAGDAVMAASSLYWFVLGRSELDQSARVPGAELAQETVTAAPERWPSLSAQASGHSVAAVDAQFRFGLDLVLTGVAHRVGDLGQGTGGAGHSRPVGLTAVPDS